MYKIKFSDNLIDLRRKKGITQEELASYVGVTKASVSKWETKQSFPDILMLPQLAMYFGVSIDELLGYQPQLDKQDIRRYYHEFADRFAKDNYEEVMKDTKELVKKYSSCYSLLLQICILWLNHLNLAQGEVRQKEVCEDIINLCDIIDKECGDIIICKDAIMLKATVDLQLGNAKEVIDLIGPIVNQKQLTQNGDSILIMAYKMVGDTDNANMQTQVNMYMNLFMLIIGATQYLDINMVDKVIGLETINRTLKIIEAFNADRLNQNISIGFYYQCSLFYSIYNMKEEAIAMIEQMAICYKDMYVKDIKLQGDSFFTRIEEWFEETDLGSDAPRNKELITADFIKVFDNPVFDFVRDEKQFERILKELRNL